MGRVGGQARLGEQLRLVDELTGELAPQVLGLPEAAQLVAAAKHRLQRPYRVERVGVRGEDVGDVYVRLRVFADDEQVRRRQRRRPRQQHVCVENGKRLQLAVVVEEKLR